MAVLGSPKVEAHGGVLPLSTEERCVAGCFWLAVGAVLVPMPSSGSIDNKLSQVMM